MLIDRLIIKTLRMTAAVMLLAQAAGAHSAEQLYDPEPPADSAYLRVIHIVPDVAVEVRVDGNPRIRNLDNGKVSEYLVLPNGKHRIALLTAGKTRVAADIETDSGHLITLAFSSLRADSSPLIFADRANSNKLKAVLAVYNLNAGSGRLDILTAKNQTPVFSNIAAGSTSQQLVRAIPIELIATQTGDKTELARTELVMSPGSAFSIFLLPGRDGKLTAQSVQSSIERYTGK